MLGPTYDAQVSGNSATFSGQNALNALSMALGLAGGIGGLAGAGAGASGAVGAGAGGSSLMDAIMGATGGYEGLPYDIYGNMSDMPTTINFGR